MNGNITISKVTGDTDWIEIRVEDDDSATQILVIRLSLEQFAHAVTGMSVTGEISRLCTVEQFKRVGKVLAIKEVYVKHPKGFSKQEQIDEVTAAVQDLLKDDTEGWSIGDHGCSSQQNGEKHKVTLERWV